MTSTIASGIYTSTPDKVLGYESARESKNVMHWIIGWPDPDITLRPQALRAGTLALFFLTEAAAAACETMHARAAVFTFSTDELATVGMRYVTTDRTTKRQETAAPQRWIVNVPYQEIGA